ncbi:MAG: hypothetical protein V4671_17155 [Armatimonadota bacterium]
MASWVRDEADYVFPQSGQSQDSKVHVTGVMDSAEWATERPKILLEDRWDNQGLSVGEDQATRDACIKGLSKEMKVDPENVDWFTRGQDNKLQSVSIGYELRTQQDPEYTKLLNAGEFNQHNKDDAKKFFPDVTVSEMRSAARPADQGQQKELAEAFREAVPARPRDEPETAAVQSPNQTRDYSTADLSQERLYER